MDPMAPRRVRARQLRIVFDPQTDVVSAFFVGTASHRVRPAPHDGLLVLEFDVNDNVIGLELCGATVLIPSAWKAHPDRALVPQPMLDELDLWLDAHWTSQVCSEACAPPSSS